MIKKMVFKPSVFAVGPDDELLELSGELVVKTADNYSGNPVTLSELYGVLKKYGTWEIKDAIKGEGGF